MDASVVVRFINPLFCKPNHIAALYHTYKTQGPTQANKSRHPKTIGIYQISRRPKPRRNYARKKKGGGIYNHQHRTGEGDRGSEKGVSRVK